MSNLPDWSESKLDMFKPYLAHFFGGGKIKRVTDIDLQSRGYDLMIRTENNYYSGTLYSVEEKTRKPFYPDVAIEFKSGDRQGWVYKLQSEFLFYHFQAGNKLLIMRPRDLKNWWLKFGDWAKENFGVVESYNPWRQYTTYCCPVPIATLAKFIFIMGYSPANPTGKVLTQENYLQNWI